MGAIGFSEKYTGTTREDDALIVALRTALSGHKVDAEQSELLRSFTAEWLIERSRKLGSCLLYTSPSPRDKRQSRMPSSA